ncbi:diguanylate cyclaSe/phosphodiesterase with PAS/PAC and GAF sensor(s) [gamma proteobacterium NOR5-3]|nr:diguanylate cyclaSe/phosphodiesterase with PAS/PAC and GAF sensor(s) [gamma proteobacterium NOR5-3]
MAMIEPGGTGSRHFREQHGSASFGLLFAVALLLTVASFSIFTRLMDWSWVAIEFHSALETVGAVIALIPVTVALAINTQTPREALGIPVICGMAGMGVFSLAHAAVPPGNAFVWLHSLAIFFGGTCFFSNFIATTARFSGVQTLYLVITAASLISLSAIVQPDAVPQMIISGQFSNFAVLLNLLGGALFLLSIPSFYRAYRSSHGEQHLLFASVAFCLGLSGVLFPFSQIWSDVWWYWHFVFFLGLLLMAGLFLLLLRRGFTGSQADAAMLAAITENANAAIYAKDPLGNYRFVNKYWEQIFGLSIAAVVGRRDEDLFPPSMARALSQRESNVMDQRRGVEFEDSLSSPNGRRAFISAKFPLLASDSTLMGLAGIYTDISDRKALEEQLEQLAHFDSLTGLPNRALARDRLAQGIAQSKRQGSRLAVLFLDIDNFKVINDSLGHHAGDELLLAMSGRLRNILRGGDTLSRLGGDEFLAVLLDVKSREDAVFAANKLLATTKERFEALGNSVHSSLSIGLALYPEDGLSIDELIQHADTAMYQAKSAGRGRVATYQRQQTSDVTTELHLLSELRDAIEHEQFELHWQPQVNLRDGSLCGAEALLRWKRPGAGCVLPQFFIPFAESHGLIAELGDWVLAAALKQIGIWAKQNSDATFSINLAPADLADDGFMPKVLGYCEEHKVTPSRVVFEITEQDVLSSLELGRENIMQLRQQGFTLSIDDFGTGNSSLLRLKKFPFHELKIDQSFVQGIPEDAESLAIVQATLSMAKALDMQVMTEGVETEQQAGFLLGIGCIKAQGFYFGRPVSAAEFEKTWI